LKSDDPLLTITQNAFATRSVTISFTSSASIGDVSIAYIGFSRIEILILFHPNLDFVSRSVKLFDQSSMSMSLGIPIHFHEVLPRRNRIPSSARNEIKSS
jgi:hypothetical protein